MRKLDIQLQANPYVIYIGHGAFQECAPLVDALCPQGKAAVVTDENVWRHHSQSFAGCDAIVLPPGEQTKSPQQLHALYDRFCEMGLRRNQPIIAFGGGVIGDLAGFAAATYQRGVPFVQVPTTLLAMVDSSVGGKVAVNLPQGKNMVGSFYQPKLVVTDTSFLTTLPAREFAAGMAEVIKYAAIDHVDLLSMLAHPHQNIEQIIHICCQSKAQLVERDEFDRGSRMMLNFGHTFGHAIEKHGAYQTYNHGEAVAIGMTLAMRVGIKLGLTDPAALDTLLPLLEAASLPHEADLPAAQMVAYMTADKKNSGGDITLVLIRRFGDPFAHTISPEKLLEVLNCLD